MSSMEFRDPIKYTSRFSIGYCGDDAKILLANRRRGDLLQYSVLQKLFSIYQHIINNGFRITNFYTLKLHIQKPKIHKAFNYTTLSGSIQYDTIGYVTITCKLIA